MAAAPRIERREPEHCLALAIAGPTTEFSAHIDEGFPDLFRRLGELGITPAGAPFIRYGIFQPEGRFALDICVPVAPGSAGDDRLRPAELPAGDYAVHVHRGAYRGTTPRWEGRDLPAAHEQVHAWAAGAGVTFATQPSDDGAEDYVAVVERYLVGPPAEDDVEKWETELAFLVAR
ncbi:GyrI-like domain-containing protein [Conexibacter stalactiti]|uniref:GyrI-like domain-containing protein n=1 Tax=Conexibacter stalactiti TaxID=1940611 RepID=A0ABU4HTH6_9ACTN|nr:GyrI-like domain-containing protein [Conexibacter stalactiti]MDW5596620.1 GyrI-like domain-containing protein [Conexibacter stalactiti]MEC5037262.1 GyrI-like domain-containing protein [Conexibacter stalactiti]